MAINPVRVDYLTVCGFIHSQNKFCVQVNIFSETVENLFSAGLISANTLKTYKLQHLVYSGLGCVIYHSNNQQIHNPYLLNHISPLYNYKPLLNRIILTL